MKSKTKKQQLITIAAVTLLAVMLIALLINCITIIRLKARQEDLRRQLSELNLMSEVVDDELAYRSNEEYLEKYAREKLEMTEDGEKVFLPR